MQVTAWFSPVLQGLNVAWTSNTSLTISSGEATSLQDTPSSPFYFMQTDAATVLDCTSDRVNGVQGGALVASKKYNVYLIGDILNLETGFYASQSDLDLYLPAGYSVKRRIFTFTTDGSAHIRAGYQTGSSLDRVWTYDAPVSALTAGTSTTYVAVDLSAYLPVVARNLMVSMKSSFTSAASGDIATLAQGDSVAAAGQAVITGFEATKVEIITVELPASSDMEIQYKVASGGSLSASLSGYVDQL